MSDDPGDRRKGADPGAAQRPAGPGPAARAQAPDYGARLRAGVIVPGQNTVAEADLRALSPPGVALLTTRLALPGERPEQLRAMGEAAVSAASLLASAGPDVIVFHCTAASTVDPAAGERIPEAITRATGLPALSTAQALVAALRALHVRRLVMLTPYSASTNAAERRFLEHHGFELLDEEGLDLTARGIPMDTVPPQTWFERLAAMRRPDADGYLLSCTNIRALPAIASLERELGAPVVGSNTAMAWHLLRHAGLRDPVPGAGRLLETP